MCPPTTQYNATFHLLNKWYDTTLSMMSCYKTCHMTHGTHACTYMYKGALPFTPFKGKGGSYCLVALVWLMPVCVGS